MLAPWTLLPGMLNPFNSILNALNSFLKPEVSKLYQTWWRHQIETFSALLAICAGNSPVTGEFSSQRPVTRSFDVFYNLRLNKRLSKPWGWWFETPSCSLWRHCNEYVSVLKCLNMFNWPYQIHLIKTAAFGAGESPSSPCCCIDQVNSI